MNEGAAHAQGELLLFLHADSELPSRYFTPSATRSGLGLYDG